MAGGSAQPGLRSILRGSAGQFGLRPVGAPATVGDALDPMDQITASSFGRRFRGEIIRPGDAGYDQARAVYNARIDLRPAVVARCRGAADVVTALKVAREHDLEVAVRGGGRHVAGYGSSDGGIVIDLGPSDGVRVDPVARRVRFGPGARNRDLLIEAEPHGLAPVTGVVGHVGAAGLTLGGGIGWLSPRHGFASDNVVALDLVTADGERLHVCADEDPELFWAMRGAGANFGVVTSFEVAAHPVPRTVLGGDLVYAGEKGPEVLRRLRDLALTCSHDLYFFALYGLAEPLPGIPSQLHGRLVLTVFAAHLGDREQAEAELAELRAGPAPDADLIRATTYVDLHLDQDEIYPEIRQYWAAEHLPLSDAAIDAIHDVACAIEDHSVIDLYPWAGAMSEQRPGDGAFACRDRGWDVATLAQWTDPARDAAQVAWAERISTELRATGEVETGVYPNMVSRLGTERLVEYFGADRWARLEALKRRLDPANRLHRNANVPPPAA